MLDGFADDVVREFRHMYDSMQLRGRENVLKTDRSPM